MNTNKIYSFVLLVFLIRFPVFATQETNYDTCPIGELCYSNFFYNKINTTYIWEYTESHENGSRIEYESGKYVDQLQTHITILKDFSGKPNFTNYVNSILFEQYDNGELVYPTSIRYFSYTILSETSFISRMINMTESGPVNLFHQLVDDDSYIIDNNRSTKRTHEIINGEYVHSYYWEINNNNFGRKTNETYFFEWRYVESSGLLISMRENRTKTIDRPGLYNYSQSSTILQLTNYHQAMDFDLDDLLLITEILIVILILLIVIFVFYKRMKKRRRF